MGVAGAGTPNDRFNQQQAKFDMIYFSENSNDTQNDKNVSVDSMSDEAVQIKGLRYKKAIFKSLAIVTLIRSFSFLIQLW